MSDSNPKKSYTGLILAGLILMSKSTKIVAALKVLKFSKPLITVISMLISAILYGIWLGPWFGVGLVLMLFIHEMGHIIALRLKGLETPGPVFIPFLGAAIFVPKFDNRDTEAYVGYGGPLLGTVGALACFAAWFFTGQDSEILLLVSYVGVFINVFNLIPVSPLDGGRITQAVGSWFKYLGVGILLLYTFYSRQPSLLLIWLLVLDGFDNFALWLKPLAGTILGLVMAGFMIAGYGSQPFWIDALDCLLAFLIVGLFWIKDYSRHQKGDDEDERDLRAYPSGPVRAKWLGYYLGLALLLGCVIAWQAEYLPKTVKANATTEEPAPPTLVQ